MTHHHSSRSSSGAGSRSRPDRRTLMGLGSLALAVALAGCGAGGGSTDAGTSAAPSPDPANPVTVQVGANPVPHAQILEYVDQNLAQEAGIDLEIEEFDDYQLPNTALDEGSIDANYYQHEPFFNAQVEERGYEFEHGAGVHIEPYAAFSEQHDSLEALPDGATIAITNDPANQPRALRMLEQAGLLQNLGENPSALTLTEEQNPRGFEFEENQPEILVQILTDPAVDLAVINGNYFIQAGMTLEDALITEDISGENPYANFLVWRTGEQTPAIQTLDELLHSEQVRQYIEQTWPGGDVVPAF